MATQRMTCNSLGTRIRRWRNILMMAAHRYRRASDEDIVVPALRRDCITRPLVIVIAYNTPDVIDIWIDRMARFAPEAVPLVCDNSNSAKARGAIETICRSKGIHYLRVPSLLIPMKRNGVRSHGMAMTWIFRRVVCSIRPKVFAFLDHDLFPVAPIDFSTMVENQPVYGCDPLRIDNFGVTAGPCGPWSLWAGFCVFRFDAVADLQLDFTADFPIGLDTGGQNWHRLYRDLDRTTIRPATRSELTVELSSGDARRIELIDAFVHIGEAARKNEIGETFGWIGEITCLIDQALPPESRGRSTFGSDASVRMISRARCSE